MTDLPSFYVCPETHQLPHSPLGNLEQKGVTELTQTGLTNLFPPPSHRTDSL